MFLLTFKEVMEMNKIIYSVIIIKLFIGNIVYADPGFEGQIVAPELNEVPQMVIKLTPERSKNVPQQITISDEEGKFQFENLEKGKYLMEMYESNELIRREVIDSRETPDKVIQFDLK
jgi:hypothetical protein